jgi:hypothetical protein
MVFLENALRYAELGYKVFPCIPGGKKPLTEHGFKDATGDSKIIAAWWETTPDANIGIATEGLVVIDIDGANNPWLADAPDKIADLLRAPTAQTPRGGRHHVFRQPTGKDWRSTTGAIAEKVDTRSNGGYIVAPPSLALGKPYEWLDGHEIVPVSVLPEPPAWLAAILDAAPPQSAHVGPQSETDGNAIPSGMRNATLARLGGAMRRVGMCYAEIKAALIQANADRCKPPLGIAEVDKIAASICRYEPDQVAVAVVEDHFAQDFTGETADEEKTPELPDPGPLPDELLRVPGFVSEVMDYCLETAPYPNQVMAFAGALSLQAFLAGRKVRDPGDNRTNIYLLGLGHSGTGKDWPRKINTKILHEIGMADSLGERFASGEGIQDALFIKPCMLFMTDEIDGLLQSINKAKDARHENIMSTLLTMYSSSNSVYPMRRKAGQESPGAIDQPCLVVFGTAIPNHYYEALSERMLTNGFFARMIILESNKRPEGQDPKILALPAGVLETAKWWSEFNPGTGNLEKWHPVPKIVEHTADAVKILTECRREAEAEYSAAEARSDSVSTTVWSRVNEQSRKLALLYAVSENHAAPSIGKEAAAWACRFVIHQTRRMLCMAQTHVAENPFHADCLKLLKRLDKEPDKMMLHIELRRHMKMDALSFQKLIQTLIVQEDIRISEKSSGGRPGTYYQKIH